MKVKQYKALLFRELANLIEAMNDWALSGWTLHTFTHQEDVEERYFSAMLEREINVEDDD